MRTALPLAFGALLVANAARAQDAEEVPPPPPPGYEDSIPPAPRASDTPPAAAPRHDTSPHDASLPSHAGARTHDGLQLRLALGIGGVTDQMEVEFPNLPAGVSPKFDASAGGATVAFHLGLGGTVSDGLALGGFLASESVTDPTIKFEGTVIPDNVDVGTLGMLGVYLDWYPDSHGGFHFGGGIGGAALQTTNDSGTTSQGDESPGGGGAILLVGYDWWIGDDWSMGILGRVLGAGLKGEDIQHSIGALSVLFSAAYN